MKTTYKDRANDNAAIIEAVKMRAYKGAAYKTGYRLTMLDTGANNFIYHVSCYETRKEAEIALYNMGFEWYKIA
jgi:hypothetical protein